MRPSGRVRANVAHCPMEQRGGIRLLQHVVVNVVAQIRMSRRGQCKRRNGGGDQNAHRHPRYCDLFGDWSPAPSPGLLPGRGSIPIDHAPLVVEVPNSVREVDVRELPLTARSENRRSRIIRLREQRPMYPNPSRCLFDVTVVS